MAKTSNATCWRSSPTCSTSRPAVELEDLERLRELLDGGADNDPDAHGFTLLHHAAELEGVAAMQGEETGHVDMVALLPARGVDPSARDDGGRTAHHFAQTFEN